MKYLPLVPVFLLAGIVLVYCVRKSIADWKRRSKMTPEQLAQEQADWFW